ncbi:MAG: hypothetical protein D6796_16445 [Caldilineae bacterium]|nr:MAG: hypothetical protein D6796_16445 [Caldilineae bacterium]
MKVLKETLGNTTLFIETLDDTLEIVGEKETGRATQLTGISHPVQAAYQGLKTTIHAIAEDIGSQLAAIRADARPKSVQMEFNLALSAQAGPIWLVSGRGDYGLKVTMTWELTSDGQRSR